LRKRGPVVTKKLTAVCRLDLLLVYFSVLDRTISFSGTAL
jgi:hypothetical protein